jgi:hypothetical protein
MSAARQAWQNWLGVPAERSKPYTANIDEQDPSRVEQSFFHGVNANRYLMHFGAFMRGQRNRGSNTKPLLSRHATNCPRKAGII